MRRSKIYVSDECYRPTTFGLRRAGDLSEFRSIDARGDDMARAIVALEASGKIDSLLERGEDPSPQEMAKLDDRIANADRYSDRLWNGEDH